MMKLDSKKYFSGSKIAEFVDSVQQGDVTRVSEGLQAGINANAEGTQGFRPIHFVFMAKNAEVLKVLLIAGADPNARLANGNTPLHFAVRIPNPDFTAVLLAYGADPNSRGENEKPVIHEALTSHQSQILKLLVKAGADLNVAWGGTTPLLASMKMFLWDMAASLVEMNANLKFRDNTDKNATERFCFQINKVPASPENKKGIPLLAAALRRRAGVLPCEAELLKFR